jgi:hypothetical protein
MVEEASQQGRHIYLNVPQAENPTPSWVGESVGHYEGDSWSSIPSTIVVENRLGARHRFGSDHPACATLSRRPIESLPDVPTLSDLGYQDIEAEAQNGVAAPARTPKETRSWQAGSRQL